MSKHTERGQFYTFEPPFPIAHPFDLKEDDIIRWTLDKSVRSHGGMGEVIYGWDRKMGRQVACKFIPTYYLTPSITLKREAQELAKIKHPNIVEVYDFIEQDGEGYLIMEHLTGKSIRERIKEHHIFVPDEQIHIMRSTARGIDYLHRKKIAHRDIKPDNILRTELGEIKIIDLGLTQNVSRELGVTVGTGDYIAPEAKLIKQQKNFDIERMRDIYALGVTFLECFAEDFNTAHGIKDNILHGAHFKLSHLPYLVNRYGKDVVDRLEPVIRKVLDKDPRRRYQTATSFAEDVERAFASKKKSLFARR